jgi:hypothetical protein
MATGRTSRVTISCHRLSEAILFGPKRLFETYVNVDCERSAHVATYADRGEATYT